MGGEWADDGTQFQQAKRFFSNANDFNGRLQKPVSKTGAPAADSFYRFGIAAGCRTRSHCSYKIAERDVRPMSVIVKPVFAWGVNLSCSFEFLDFSFLSTC